MKLVKKLLRLLPLFYILSLFLFFVFQKGFTFTDVNSFNSFYTAWVSKFVESPFFGLTEIFQPIEHWFSVNIWSFFDNSNQYIYILAFNVLEYELILSLMFLIFDVFNYILGIANKFINKGEDI